MIEREFGVQSEHFFRRGTRPLLSPQFDVHGGKAQMDADVRGIKPHRLLKSLEGFIMACDGRFRSTGLLTLA